MLGPQHRPRKINTASAPVASRAFTVAVLDLYAFAFGVGGENDAAAGDGLYFAYNARPLLRFPGRC